MFKNLTLFRIPSGLEPRTVEALDDALRDNPLMPCGPLEMESSGMVPALGLEEDEHFAIRVGRYWKVRWGCQKRLLPSAVVLEEVTRRVKAIAQVECREVGQRERRRIKERVVEDLMGRAFVRTTYLDAFLDPQNGWFIVDTPTRKHAEEVGTTLRNALGSFPITPVVSEAPPQQKLTYWLAGQDMPDGLVLGDACELVYPTESASAGWKGKSVDLGSDEVQEHLRCGMRAKRLALVWSDKLAFSIDDSFSVKHVERLTEDEDHEDEDAASAMMADLLIHAGDVSALIERMTRWFQIHGEEDVTTPQERAA